MENVLGAVQVKQISREGSAWGHFRLGVSRTPLQSLEEAPCVDFMWSASRQRNQTQRFQRRDELSVFRGHEGARVVEHQVRGKGRLRLDTARERFHGGPWRPWQGFGCYSDCKAEWIMSLGEGRWVGKRGSQETG